MTLEKEPIALVGATGMVGQMCIALLEEHEHFELSEIVASDKREGKKFSDEVNWVLDRPMPRFIKEKTFSSLEKLKSSYVISALPGDLAITVEKNLSEKGHFVFSNASAYRMHKNVPLLIPEINSHSLSLLKEQQTKGKIVTNPNCSTVMLTLALNPLKSVAAFKNLNVVTLQAVSGAGYPGVSSLDILGDVVPYIPSEEEKMVEETYKILDCTFPMHVTCHRVGVFHGHSLAVHLEFEKDFDLEHVKSLYSDSKVYELIDHESGPRPNRHLQWDDMKIYLGRFRQGQGKNILQMSVLGHNLVRGAAGAALGNAQLYKENH